MKPTKPITRREIYFDVITGGDATLPTPLTREETYLAKIAGENIEIPSPVTRYEQYLAAISGEAITVPEPLTRLEKLLYKATGEDIEVDSPVTREESYWYDYEGGGGETEKEYAGAVPTTIIANGEPLLAYRISGNMQQTGTPTPDNPIQPQETGERTGNLFDESLIQNGYYGSSGSISIFTIDDRYRAFSMAIKAGTYTIKIQADEGIRLLRIATTNEYYNVQEDNKAYTFVISADATMYVSWRNLQTTNSFTNMKVMLNSGSTAMDFEPYGYKIPISSGGVTTPVYLSEPIRKIGEYADSVADGTATRNIKKLVLTGEENWYIEGSDVFYTDPITEAVRYTPICSHFIGVNALTGNNQVTISQSLRINIKTTTITHTASDFKAYLAAQYAAGTPVTIWYVLATPITETISAPTIPTVAGSQTFDVDTTLKPSEVYIKYKGK